MHLVVYLNIPYPATILCTHFILLLNVMNVIIRLLFHIISIPFSYLHLETVQKRDPHLKKENLNKACK